MKHQIKQLINRCDGLSLNGIDGSTNEQIDVSKLVKERLLAMASAQTNLAIKESDSADVKEAKAQALQTLRDALNGDRKALRSLNALRLETVDNFIKASSNFIRFFNVVTLKADEEPGIKNETMNEIKCGYVAQHGSPRSMKIEPNQAHARIPLRYVTSDRVGYFTQDIYKGDISGLAQKTFDIAFDLNFKLDRLTYDLLTASLVNGGAYGAFVTTGAKASRDYNPHSGVQTTHLPTTNDITVNATALDNSGAIVGKFGVRVLQEIIRYSDSWANVFSDGRIVPTGEIIVPASDLFAVLTDLTLISGASGSETSFESQVAEKGYTELDYAGKRWRFVPDVTIPKKKCYPIFTKKPGNVYFKPDLDQEFTFTDQEKHWEERSQQKVFGAYIIKQHRMNVARFTYAS
jgi:hypothetical protein